jgi:DNA-binding response OmpR family regulator
VANRVLIVEDEDVLRQVMARFLAGRGLVVAAVASLGEAREALAAGPFDALVLDVGLPDGDGLDLLERAGAARALVVSAAPDPARYARRGVVHHLPKPLDLRRVLDRVSAICAAA